MEREWLSNCTAAQLVAIIKLRERYPDLTVDEFLDRCVGPLSANSMVPYASFRARGGLFYGIERDAHVHT
jgi:hypothetical protein